MLDLSAMQGLPTIRAYGAGERFRATFLAELDANGCWWFAFMSTARWCAGLHVMINLTSCNTCWVPSAPFTLTEDRQLCLV